jgi:hypothetical protein
LGLDGGHLVFFWGFWYGISNLGAGMAFCILKSLYDTINDDGKSHGH